jgi:HAD superfamily hydrolase (TIGR01484 family)
MMCPKAALFDLDDTLAESFEAPKPEIVARLRALLERIPVAILTAAGFPRIERDFLMHLQSSEYIDRLYIFPNSATECFVFQNDSWHQLYNFNLSEEERSHIKAALETAAAKVGTGHPEYAPQLWDRGSQIAYAMIKSDAPQEIKKSWDPDQAKRTLLKTALEKMLPEHEVRIGGNVTIDITKKGIDKAYGVTWLHERLGIPTGEMLYVGDALYQGGNDAVVIPTGIQVRSTSGPTETLRIMDEILSACSM